MSQSFFNFLNRFVMFNSFRHAFGVFHRLNPPQAAAIQTSLKEGGVVLSRMWLNAKRLPLKRELSAKLTEGVIGAKPQSFFFTAEAAEGL